MEAQHTPGLGRAGRIVAVVIRALPGAGIWWLNQSAKRRSAEATVEIIGATRAPWTEGDESKEGYAIRYRYQVAGQVYEGGDRWESSEPTVPAVKVCHNPSNPSDHSLVESRVQCGKGLF